MTIYFKIFREIAYKAQKREHLAAGIDEFLDVVTLLPPNEWDPSIRIEPPEQVSSQEERYQKIMKEPPPEESKVGE